MLAYDLFLQNKTSTDNIVKRVTPIKKIYVTSAGFEVDKKTLEEYGKKIREKTRSIQEYLLMPLNNSNAQRLNLPIANLSPNSPRPYVEIFGNLKIKKLGKEATPVIELTISGKDADGSNKGFSSEISVNKGKIDFTAEGNIKLRLDDKNYRIGGQNLYESYVNLKVIKPDGGLSADTFKKICTAFLNFANSRKENIDSRIKQSRFSIFVIPGYGAIQCVEKKNEVSRDEFVDAFGVRDSSFSNKTTKTAQFLSSDDPAFTLNCKERAEFYENLGISSQSLDRVNIPSDSVFDIAGLSWLFSSIDDPDLRFEETGKGVYFQIFRNFQKLDKKFEDDPKYQALMKVMCFKRSQAKLEILLDENLTMNRMREIFQSASGSDIPFLGFEVLIEKTRNSILWNYYIAAVRSLLSGRAIDREHLLSYLTVRMRKKVHNWIKEDTNEARDFYSKSAFCLKTLSTSREGKFLMSEQYAERIGRMAAKYIEFRKAADEDNNSLRDMLAYAKYDREKLRFVLSKIGQGINLSKARKENVEKISGDISSLMPKEEIPDLEASKDYSYFFYKGVFSKE